MHQDLEQCIYPSVACCCKWLENFNLHLETLLMNLKGVCSFFCTTKWLRRSLHTWVLMFNNICSKCKVEYAMQVCAIIRSWCWSSSLSPHVRNITWQDQSQGNGNMLGCPLGNRFFPFTDIWCSLLRSLIVGNSHLSPL